MNSQTVGAAILGAALAGSAAAASPIPSTTATTTYHRTQVDGVGIFYREAGPKDAPTIVLLHGFPSSSREFDTLIPLLATRYHLIAPDFPASVRATLRRRQNTVTPSTISPRQSMRCSSSSRSPATRSTCSITARRSVIASCWPTLSDCTR